MVVAPIKAMFSFPYVGLVNRVSAILLEKARRNDIAEKPNYYEIAYAFHIQRGDYRQGRCQTIHIFVTQTAGTYCIC